MFQHTEMTRRGFVARMAGLGAMLARPERLFALETVPTRPIPVSGEQIPIVGFGSTKAVLEIPEEGAAPIAEILRVLLRNGGRVVDTSPRSEAIDQQFGAVLQDPAIADQLFIAAKIYTDGEENGIAQFRQVQRTYGRRTVDVLQVESLRDLQTHWPNVRRWKESGEARYIGVTVFLDRDHQALEDFMRRETFDFVHLNYSVSETNAEQRLLPLAQDRGMAVLVNRPFMNGDFFDRVEGVPLPEWASELGCRTWAQFSLKYVLGHPAVTCVLTETTNPAHMQENLEASFGVLPDAATKRRMREYLLSV